MKYRTPCSATVFSDRHSWPCSRNAKVVRDGKGYCTQHDPVRMKAGREERARLWRERRKLVENCQRANTFLHGDERAVILAAKAWVIAPSSTKIREVLLSKVETLKTSERAATLAREALEAYNKENA